MIEKTRASRPSYFPAIRAVQKFKEARIATLTPVELEAINEISRRLTRLDNQVDELININNSFIEQRAPQVQFDAETDTITFRFRDIEQKIKLKRANPNKPIQSDTRSVAGVYKAGQTTEENQEQNPNELVFESALEDHYQNAHKVLKLVRSLPGLRNFECREITIVRNKLVEHAEKTEVYSFGFGTDGPTVRPLHSPGREWIDRGLVHNIEAFVKRLAEAFEP